ncbi:hypothetical protein OIU84_000295 [Salix udensis]|uniref:Uncharacterized protein n=1 Tax=Salix udensis TaxID=889485 RepID=A0AAD6PLV5_9ROSI|nr:hypothetical protein OIU84_000295 [Salix udensis]
MILPLDYRLEDDETGVEGGGLEAAEGEEGWLESAEGGWLDGSRRVQREREGATLFCGRKVGSVEYTVGGGGGLEAADGEGGWLDGGRRVQREREGDAVRAKGI